MNGGINCFNYDLVIACAQAKREDNRTKICCVVPDLTDEQQAEMQSFGIIPITLSGKAFDSPEAIQLIFDQIKSNRKLHYYYPDKCNTFCIGHDIYTGNLSKCLAQKCAGWNIVFHHMNYSSYYLLGKSNVSAYEEKVAQQKDVLRHADLVFAVGPLLLKSAQDIVRCGTATTKEVLPGLATFNALPTPPNYFSPIVFGRIEENNQRIKQIPLAIDAFATAIAMDKDTPVIGDNSTLLVIGYESDDLSALKEEVCRLRERTYEIAQHLCNVVPLPYIHDRAKLGEQLQSASVAMMLSFHEGFGLVGYEAIAAGVPLIISKNSGLYMFLEREQLDHLVYPVQIAGSDTRDGYSQDDLEAVAKALRTIRQNENCYKKKAMELRDILLSTPDKYSWRAIANNLIQTVCEWFEDELKSFSTVFLMPNEVTKLDVALKNKNYSDIVFCPSTGIHMYTIKGENALASLMRNLQKEESNDYEIFIYNMQTGEGGNSSYLDFLNNCRATFGESGDPETRGFEYVLGNRLRKTILILDEFSEEYISDFEDLFRSLNEQNFDFYIFAVIESDSAPQITPFNKEPKPSLSENRVPQKSILTTLTPEEALLIKVLAFRGKRGYSKRLVNFICNNINDYYQKEAGELPIFKDSKTTEEKLKEYGLITEYSEYSYQNVEAYLEAVSNLEVDNKSYALGLSILGLFYARCYYRRRGRDQQLSWGYFSCKCFSHAATLDDSIKKEIKSDYEMILSKIRKRAMDTSDYSRYRDALQRFIDEYQNPDDPWIWYTLIHCETIFCPTSNTLIKANRILETEFSDPDAKSDNENALYVQFIRLVAELEYELDIDGALENLLGRIEALPEKCQSGIAWNQCLVTIINLAINKKKYGLAEQYLEQHEKIATPDELYPKMIRLTMKTDLKIAKQADGYTVNLKSSLSDITRAFRIAKDTLQDYRAQGWISGLWGECQILLGDSEQGEKNLQKSMRFRMSGGESTKMYRNWLQRISRYSLQPYTRMLLEAEMKRMEICPVKL